MIRRVFVLVVLLAGLAVPAAARADFGFVPGSMRVGSLERDGTNDYRAGSHPYAFSIAVELKGVAGQSEGGRMRDLIFDLPPGLLGNPLAVPSCPTQSFDRLGVGASPECPPSTQIGIVHATIAGLGEVLGPLYNLSPGPGAAAELGFAAYELIARSAASLRSEEGLPNEPQERYGIQVATDNLPAEATAVEAVIWGSPADPGHLAQRGPGIGSGSGYGGQESEAPERAFFTLPTSCERNPVVTARADSVLSPGAFVSESAPVRSVAGAPAPLVGCESVPFSPGASAGLSTGAAESPAAFDFGLQLPNLGLLAPAGVAETQPVKTVVTLPQGVTANPAAATGLGGCSEAQFAAASVTDPGCPANSKLGTLLASSPLLEEPIEGSVYLATPQANRFGTLLALYIVASAPERGVLIKQAGRVDVDPGSGQLTATFDGLPPVPYSSFEVRLREGSRAPLMTPQACGTYTTTAALYPYSAPGSPVVKQVPFTVSSGAGGAACSTGEAQEPNSPSFQAGTTVPLAGAYSPFVLKLSREDGSQRLKAIDTTLPEGLLGKLAGVPYCSDAQIAAAAARSGEGQGALEQSSPSCPAASQVGVVNITAGAGPQPYPVQGNAYLAGPYKNAPLSLAIITPALAGPFDLGTVVVRVALYIDPNTAQISAVSDPLPTILYGIPLDVRSVSLEMNRAGFMFNPTSCEAMSVTGQAISTLGQAAGLSDRFRVGGCQGLPFKPSLTASTAGKTSKTDGASLTVKVSQNPGEANIHKVDLTIPTALPARLTTLQKACTEAQFNANPAGCPAGSFIGTATAITPILNVPLVGPAIIVSHGGAAFPDVEFLLQANERGSVIQVDLDGKTDIKNGVTYSRFETVPDAPITSFETTLGQGPHSILGVNLPPNAKYSLCGQKLTIPTTITGQNGAQTSQATPIAVTGCSTAMSFAHRIKQRTLTLTIYAPAAGKITATGKGLTRKTKTAKGQEHLTITLKQRKAGKLKTKVRLTYTPTTGKDRKKQVKSAKLRFRK